MSELKATTVYDAYWKANSTVEGTCILVYLKSEADKVIADLEESHKMEIEQLLMEIAGLKKLVETADKLLKPKGGFTIKDVKFGGVKLGGIKETDK
jgi:hypothetical protein